MLSLDVSPTLGKAITPSLGIPDQELIALRTSMKRYTEEWLQERKLGEHAWSMDPYDKKAIARVKSAAMRAKSEGIRTVVWVGIGGSGLGPRVMQEVFENVNTLEWITMDSIDPATIQTYMDLIDWTSTLLVIASKSGDTLEPMSLFFLCFQALKNAVQEKAPDRTIAVTDPETGFLRSFALEYGIPILPIPPKVGGRFSIFSPVGLLPLALLDADIDAFVRGAKEIDTRCQEMTLEENPAALLASVQFLLDTKRGYPLRVIMPYSTRLQSLGRWDQQLIAESLGKKETWNPIPFAAIGTQDQHSLLQQWIEGPRKSWHLFIREEEKPRVFVPEDVGPHFEYMAGKSFGQLLDACLEGTSGALTQVKRPHATVTLTRLDAEHLGSLFFFLLTEVIFLAKLYRIEPYGQPGVEIGKKITKEILSRGKRE
jgi:glucose-6-phosphate isomerase